jgi:alpha-2-macroglobulin
MLRSPFCAIAVAMALLALPVSADAESQAGSGIPIRSRQIIGDAAQRAFEFRRVVIPAKGDSPSACLRFSQPLSVKPETHYEDFVRVEPGPAPAVIVSGSDLCLGGLRYGPTYRVKLLRGLPAASGDITGKEQTIPIDLVDRPPAVSIAGYGFVLPRGESNGLTIQTVNLDRIRVHVLRVNLRGLERMIPNSSGPFRFGAPPNFPQLLSASQMSRAEIADLLANSAVLVWSGTMSVDVNHNRQVDTAFPIANVIKPGEPGAYLVIAENPKSATPEDFFSQKQDEPDTFAGKNAKRPDFARIFNDPRLTPWARLATHWVVSTDLALTTMTGTDGLHVFARSLATAIPLAQVRIALIASDGDQLGTGLTDKNGEAAFSPGLLRGSGAAAARTIAADAPSGDFALADLHSPALDLSDRGVAGRPRTGPIDAFVYTDRGIYRPGEVVQSMTLLRDAMGRAIDTMPLTLILRRPDGVEAGRANLQAQAAGGFHQPLRVSPTAALGLWTVEAYVDPTGRPVGRGQFDVQDFVPQQLKVTLSAAKPFLTPGQSLGIELTGEFLYGAKASGLGAEGQVRIEDDPNPVPNAKAYRFGLVDEKLASQAQKLVLDDSDENGRVRVDTPLSATANTTHPVKAVVTAGLYEPGGRYVSEHIELPIRTRPVLLGIKPLFSDERVAMQSDAAFEIRAFSDDGKPIARPGAKWSLVQEEEVFDWYNMRPGVWEWHYHLVDVPVATGSLDIAAATPARLLQHVEYGSYRLIVSDPHSKAATSIRFMAGWSANAVAEETPDKVELSFDHRTHEPGDVVMLHVKGPFAGTAQVTIAGDRIYQTRQIEIPAGGADIPIKSSSRWGAGAYALVTLYRPLKTGRAHDPVRAIGVAWLGLDPTPHTLSVAMNVASTILPRQKIKIPIKITGARAGDPTYITLAAVDEGILQLTRFATPDPVAHFYGQKMLGLDIRDEYGRLLDGSAPAGPIHEGGDQGIGGPSGIAVTSRKTIALLSGPVEVDARGEAAITLDIPDFEGQLRFMAVAYNKNAVGAADRHVTVRDPVVADLYLPRFLAPGDRADLTFLLQNGRKDGGSYHVAIRTSGPVHLTSAAAFDVALKPGERKASGVSVAAGDEGVGTLDAEVTGPGHFKLAREWQIAIRGAHYPLTLESAASQSPGEAFKIDPAIVRPFLAGRLRISVNYSGLPGVDVPGLLQSLWRYPFGCTEQLSSIAFPLLYYNDAKLVATMPGDDEIRERVQNAIDAILDRQDASGEFGLWRVSDREDSPWLNVYALDFLMHAKDAGYAVPDGALQRGFGHLQRSLAAIDLDNRGVYSRGSAETLAYGEYVLARASQADIGVLRRIADNLSWTTGPDGQVSAGSVDWIETAQSVAAADPLSLGEIAGALSLMNDRVRADRVFARAVANLDVRTVPIWWRRFSYYSPIRDLAGLIAVAAEVKNDAVAAQLSDRLSNLRLAPSDLDTQEKAWLLLAIHDLNRTDAKDSLTVDGARIAAPKLPTVLSPRPDQIRAGYSVTNTGDRPLWRELIVQGMPKDAPSDMEQGLTLTKEYFDLDGKSVDVSRLHQNDRIIVSLRGVSTDREDHHVALIDLLPSGWEIEAPIQDDSDDGFLGPLSRTNMEEARDDRFVAAFDLDQSQFVFRTVLPGQQDALDRGEFHLAYLVRVVTPGNFTLPEAVVQDMYRPQVMARTAAGHTADTKP